MHGKVDEAVLIQHESNKAEVINFNSGQRFGFSSKLRLRQLDTKTSIFRANSANQFLKSIEQDPKDFRRTVLHLMYTYGTYGSNACNFKNELRIRGGSCFRNKGMQKFSSNVKFAVPKRYTRDLVSGLQQSLNETSAAGKTASLNKASKALDKITGIQKQRKKVLKQIQMSDDVRLISCANWATLEQLTSNLVPTIFSNQDLTNLSDQIVYFKRLWLNSSRFIVSKNHSADLSLSRHFREDAFWMKAGCTQKVFHLVPHSAASNKFWNPLLYFFTGRPGLHYFNASFGHQMEFYRFVNGFDQNQENCSKFPFSPLIDARANHILMRFADQMDDVHALLMVPLMPIHELLAWDGEAYDVLIIPRTARVFCTVGACASRESMKSHAHLISSKEKRVEEGFNALGLVFSLLVYLMKDSVNELTECEQRLSKRNFASLLNFTKNSVLFPVPTLPAGEVVFRCTSFDKAGCGAHGTFGHPAPHPLLLLCRALNAWLAFLFEQRDQNNHHFEYLKDIVVPSGSQGCVLLPSCTDLPGLSSCAMCFARTIVDDVSDVFQNLDNDRMEAVRSIYRCEGNRTDLKFLSGIISSAVEKATFEDSYSEEVFDYCTSD